MFLICLLALIAMVSTRASPKNFDDIFNGKLKGGLSQSSESNTSSDPLGGDLSPDDTEEQREWVNSIIKDHTGEDAGIQKKTSKASDEESGLEKTYSKSKNGSRKEGKKGPQTSTGRKNKSSNREEEKAPEQNNDSSKKDQDPAKLHKKMLHKAQNTLRSLLSEISNTLEGSP